MMTPAQRIALLIPFFVMSTLVACGERQELKNTVKKATGAPHAEAQTGGGNGLPNTSGTPGSEDIFSGAEMTEADLIQLAASDSCAAPFTNFELSQNERELKAEDFKNDSATQWGADLAGKKVALRLNNAKLWTELKSLEKNTVDQIAGEITVEGDSSVTCHTMKRDREEGSAIRSAFTFGSLIDLQNNQDLETQTLALLAQKDGVKSVLSGSLNDEQTSSLEIGQLVGGTIEKVLTRIGDDQVLMRVKATQLSSDGKAQVSSIILATYDAVDATDMESIEQDEEEIVETPETTP